MSAQQEQTTSGKPTSSTMTELIGDYITNLETECVRLRKENSELRIEIERFISCQRSISRMAMMMTMLK